MQPLAASSRHCEERSDAAIPQCVLIGQVILQSLWEIASLRSQ
jgi:hypothetical protein